MITRFISVGVKLPVPMVEQLDQLAIDQLTNRSQILRNIVSSYLEFKSERQQIEYRTAAFNAGRMTDAEITEELQKMKSVFSKDTE